MNQSHYFIYRPCMSGRQIKYHIAQNTLHSSVSQEYVIKKQRIQKNVLEIFNVTVHVWFVSAQPHSGLKFGHSAFYFHYSLIFSAMMSPPHRQTCSFPNIQLILIGLGGGGVSITSWHWTPKLTLLTYFSANIFY